MSAAVSTHRITRLCIVRHGETAGNAEHRVQGQLDVPLSAVGQAQALALSKVLAAEEFSAIYSSDLSRARQTAAPVANLLSMRVNLEKDLRERHYGIFQRLTYAEALGELCESLVFVGGCASGLLLTSVRANAIRVTQDVDVVAKVATLRDYHAIEAAVAARGFAHDVSASAPICRWVRDGILLDLMPSEAGILGFHKRWYPLAAATASRVALPSGRQIRLIAAPAFIATKIEAFKGRGREDYLASHDLEDIVTVVDGRAALLDEARQSPAALRRYLAEEIGRLLASDGFAVSLAGHLPGDAISQVRLGSVIVRLRELSNIG